MSVASVASTPSQTSPLSALEGTTGGGNSIAADLSSFAQAKTAGNTSDEDAALLQLKTDLANERTSLLAQMMGNANDTSGSSDIGDSLLSQVFNLSSNATINSALGDVQQAAAQNGVDAAASSASTSSSSAPTNQTASTAAPAPAPSGSVDTYV